LKVVFITNLYPSKEMPYKGSFVKNIYDGFSNSGIDVSLIKLEYVGMSKWVKLLSFINFYVKSFFAALFAKEGHIFYIHYASHSSLGVLLASIFRELKIVTNVHGSDVLPEVSHGKYSSRINYTLSKFILYKSTMIVSPSEYFKSILHDKYNVSQNSIFVSPSGGVDNAIFHPQNTPPINQDIKFGYIGRIEAAKGIFDLLTAYIDLLKLHSNISLTVIGSGSAYKKVDRMTKKINSINLIHGLPQNELVEYYSSFDYFIFPSHHESLGLAPIESLMCGTPVICSAIGAAKYYIKEDLSSFSFQPGNSDELLTSLNKAVLTNSKRYSELVSLGCCIAREYESKKVIDELISSFKDRFDM
jgi:glycosyltransferase involved in cell wall biosynthesis